MASIRGMLAGGGYRYLLGGRWLAPDSLLREKETPPGYRLGTGVHGFGIEDQRIEVGGTVTADHLRRRLGLGASRSRMIRSASAMPMLCR